MPDQPLFKLAHVGFQMKLRTEYVAANGKRLANVYGDAGQVYGVGRNVELIAMPVQNRGVTK
jgi:hypothetical protein